MKIFSYSIWVAVFILVSDGCISKTMISRRSELRQAVAEQNKLIVQLKNDRLLVLDEITYSDTVIYARGYEIKDDKHIPISEAIVLDDVIYVEYNKRSILGGLMGAGIVGLSAIAAVAIINDPGKFQMSRGYACGADE